MPGARRPPQKAGKRRQWVVVAPGIKSQQLLKPVSVAADFGSDPRILLPASTCPRESLLLNSQRSQILDLYLHNCATQVQFAYMFYYCLSRLESTWKALQVQNQLFVIVSSTGQAALYLFSSDARQLFELKAFHEEYRSWFIGQAVQHDGCLFFATPVDPLFLALFYLNKAEKEQRKFQPLDQILVDEEFSSCVMLQQCTAISQLIHHIADVKEIERKKFFKYSEEKTLIWLKKKVNQTVKVLKEHGVCVGGRVQSATFISGKEVPDATEEDYIRFAHGLLSEYIPEELSTTLARYICLSPITPPASEPASKKRKLSDAPVEAEEDYTKFNSSNLKNKKGSNKMSAAQKALAKVDKSGMKALSSFFSSKTKATK